MILKIAATLWFTLFVYTGDVISLLAMVVAIAYARSLRPPLPAGYLLAKYRARWHAIRAGTITIMTHGT